MSMIHSTDFEPLEIPGWPGYRATRGGHILCFRAGRWKPMGVCLQNGYLETKLRRDGKRSTVHVHTLILTTYRGPCPDGMLCRHLDGNPMNNRISNLAWGTPLENARDTVRHGRTLRGSLAKAAKLTENDVAQIRWYVTHHNYTPAMVARCWPISVAQAGQICSGKAWKHVDWIERPMDGRTRRAKDHGINHVR